LSATSFTTRVTARRRAVGLVAWVETARPIAAITVADQVRKSLAVPSPPVTSLR
jgi:hypothetical protein